MDDFDFNIDNFQPGARRKRVSERKVRRHDTPDPTPTKAFDQDEPTIETIRVVHDENPGQPSRHTEESPRRSQPTRSRTGSNRTENATRNSRPAPRRYSANSIIAPFMDRRLHIFLGVLAVVIGVVMAVVLFSHLRTAAADQSKVINMTVSEMSQHPEAVKNTGGAFGAWLSHVLFADALGLGSFVVAIYLLVIGACMIARLKINFWSFTFKSVLLAVSVSIVTGLVTYEADSAVFWGGTHGHFVNKFLFDNASLIGALAVSIVLVAAVVCVFYHPICHFLKKTRTFLPPLHRPRYDDMPSTRATAAHPEDTHAITVDTEKEPVTDTPETDKTPTASLDTDVTPVAMSDTDEGGHNPIPSSDTSVPHQSGVAFAIDDINEVDDIDESPERTPKPLENADSAHEPAAGDPQFTVTVATPEETSATTGSVEGPRPMGDGALDHRLTMPDYVMPTLDLLEERAPKRTIDMEEQQANKDRIVKTLADYGITVSKISATVGPTVTLFEIIPTEGTRISKIKNLEDDIAMALAARGIRIIAPIPGKGAVGIEVPNSEPQTVSMRQVLNSAKFRDSNKRLPVALGATISNEVFVTDLAAMPHALVAGATGQGKSVGLNAIITSLLYKKHPTELKFVLIDPKMVEFSLYSKIEKHYLAKLPDEDEAIITDSNKVLNVLNSLCVEMDQRYELLKDAGVRDIVEYNRKFTQGRLSSDNGHKYLPYIVVVIDEFADLIITGRKEIEPPVIRITQKGRSAGIHMIIATQRPSTNVLTGLIKANCPARIAFRVQQMVDSRCILDQPGANQLIGRGDMLYSSAGGSMERIQCAFISTDEVENVVDFIDRQRGVDTYILPDPLLAAPVEGSSGVQNDAAGGTIGVDPLLKDCAYFFVSQGFGSKPSTSVLQRRFSIGYNRAGKIMDQLQAAGIVSAPHGPTRERSLLADAETVETILGQRG